MTDQRNPRSVFFEKDGDKIVIWTNHKRWTVTDMEIIELSTEIEEAGLGQIDLVRAALERWGQR